VSDAGDRVERPLRIGVVGAGEARGEVLATAEAVGREIARAGAVVVNGGGGGVMAASARGAVAAGGLTVGLLQGGEPRDANPWTAIPLPTGMGQGRNLLVVRASEALVVVGGGWGTLSEIALAGKVGRPVVIAVPPEAGSLGLPTRSEPVEAVREALRLASDCREIPHG
jgi:hypothetical protein